VAVSTTLKWVSVVTLICRRCGWLAPCALTATAGLPAAQVQAVLDGDAYADAVRADERQAARYGITGVPFFVADGKYAVSGAQPPEVLLQLLRRAKDETSQLTPVAVTTDSNSEAACDGDSCAAG
jgi:hypothetical protein